MDFLTLSNDQTFYVFPLIFCIPLHFVYFMLHHDGLSVVCWISLSVCACVSPTIIFNGGTSTLNNFSFLEYCLPAVYFLPAWLACWWAMEYTFDCLCVCEWLTTSLVVAVVGVMPYFANINCKCNNKQQQYQQFLSHTNTLYPSCGCWWRWSCNAKQNNIGVRLMLWAMVEHKYIHAHAHGSAPALYIK